MTAAPKTCSRLYIHPKRNASLYETSFGCLYNWYQLVACARAAYVTCCLYLDCSYNWLPVVGRQDISKTRQDAPRRAQDASPTPNQAQATSYTGNTSTGNQLYRQPRHRQPVIQAAQVQATIYTGSPSSGSHLYKQPKRR